MSAGLPRGVLEELRTVDWYGDWDTANSHRRSRALLMREYLRRAALWARAYGAEEAWPFFDVTEHAAPGFEPPPDLAAELAEYVSRLGTPSLRRVCRGAVRWAALRADATGLRDLPELPDPYEPLLFMFGRGGGYSVEEFIDLYGVLIPHGNLDSNLHAEPFLTLAPSTLDALDAGADGRISYYSSPLGVLRRRLVGRESTTYDEIFTRDFRWEPTDCLSEIEHVQITEPAAAAVIDGMTR
ncbi:hypothetical protein [Streptomyces sp. NPDC053542]|uniref:hypothetical protein n=1 Tax=Streptomyces sp. NPDC053542 TaxID=3365710 RepID=UPI0037D4A123